jgi:hypothetical protein
MRAVGRYVNRTNKDKVLKKYREAFAWRAAEGWYVSVKRPPYPRIGFGSTARYAWEDAAMFIKWYGG